MIQTRNMIVIDHSLNSVSICHVFDHFRGAENNKTKTKTFETCEIYIDNSIINQ